MSEAQDYPLGHSAQEAKRLADQAAQLDDFTEDVFRRAGLRRGMQVLDIGSGVGDVSLDAFAATGAELDMGTKLYATASDPQCVIATVQDRRAD